MALSNLLKASDIPSASSFHKSKVRFVTKNSEDIKNALSRKMASDLMSPSIYLISRFRRYHFAYLIFEVLQKLEPYVL